jgi:hypothetical protein
VISLIDPVFPRRKSAQDYEFPKLLLGIREGAILYAPLSFLKSHCGSSLRHFKRIASDIGAGFDESLMVCPPRTGVGIGSVALSRGKSSGDSMTSKANCISFLLWERIPVLLASEHITDGKLPIRHSSGNLSENL